MPIYRWKGINSDGSSLKGIASASSPSTLKADLLTKGIALLDHRQQRSLSFRLIFFRNAPRIRRGELAKMFDYLALLINSGIPITKALTLCANHISQQPLKGTLEHAAQQVERGENFASSLAPQLFTPLIIKLIRTGEKTGSLGITLEKIANYLHTQEETRATIKKAFIMPLVTLGFSLLIIGLIFFAIIPQFSLLYQTIDKPIPKSTQRIIALSAFMQSPQGLWLWIALGILILFFYMLSQQDRIKNLTNAFFLRLPIIKEMVINQSLINWLETCSVCLRTGMPLRNALHEAADAVINKQIHEASILLFKAVERGQTLNESMNSFAQPYFPPPLVTMISIGEQTGSLESMVHKASIFYQGVLATSVRTMTMLLQPCILIGIGIIIASLLISVYLPILNLVDIF